MLGQAFVLEAIEDPRVESLLLVNRRPSEHKHPKVREIIHEDFQDFSNITHEFGNIGAVCFCLGTSAVGKNEELYTKITLGIVEALVRELDGRGEDVTFLYISGQGTDSSEKGRMMWARVKGRTENFLIDNFHDAYMFRPGFILPEKGVRSSTSWYRVAYQIVGFMYPVLKRVFPGAMVTSTELADAQINAIYQGYHRKILEVKDIQELAANAE